MNLPAYFNIEPFDNPVLVMEINPIITEVYDDIKGVEFVVTHDEIVTADAGTFLMYPGTIEFAGK
jgi:hypothetical protein